jgi:hypothetical protein
MCEQHAYDLSVQKGFRKYLGSILLNLGRIQRAIGNKALATAYYRRGINESITQNYLRGVVAGKLLLAELYRQSGQKDSIFCLDVILPLRDISDPPQIMTAL